MAIKIVCVVCGNKFDDVIERDRHIFETHPDGDSTADMQPESADEQSMSGSTPHPESDDDLLENAHAVGEQLEEDEEHPKEVDIARDIDKNEEYLRTH